MPNNKTHTTNRSKLLLVTMTFDNRYNQELHDEKVIVASNDKAYRLSSVNRRLEAVTLLDGDISKLDMIFLNAVYRWTQDGVTAEFNLDERKYKMMDQQPSLPT